MRVGETMLARRPQDGCDAVPDEAGVATYPHGRVLAGQEAEQGTGVGDGNGADHERRGLGCLTR
jgi:hypothetical protein